ncbi:MAG: hypothetical protein ACK5UX_01455 [Burkholderiales bacterium]
MGMVVIVAREHVDQAMALLTAKGERVYVVGEIRTRPDGAHQTIVQ